uniref:DDE Tnp4 domain-containing protein n=1 Tax=Graphocephala atropunctata TaxID=36148 RepID=A0A1B6MNX0_9HEMI
MHQVGFLVNVGDHSGIHKSTTSKIVKQVSEAIARLRPQFISMPSSHNELSIVKAGFYEKARFPNCIGALDCTHVKIQSPGGEHAEHFRNRKGIFSINVQGVCDSALLFRNVVARWPGSTHDSHIFTSSRLKQDFENGLFGNGVLVGDSGYACTNYLIPPLDNPILQEEQLYQESQIQTRNPIERCFGVWKRRFPVLALGIRLKVDGLENVCVATAILHNGRRRYTSCFSPGIGCY